MSGRPGIPRVDRANKAPLLAPLLFLPGPPAHRQEASPGNKSNKFPQNSLENKQPGHSAETRCFCCRGGAKCGGRRVAAVAGLDRCDGRACRLPAGCPLWPVPWAPPALLPAVAAVAAPAVAGG